MRRMEKITGRSDDMMIVRGVNVFPTQIEELILKQDSLAPHYVCILDRDGPMDTLTVQVETGGHSDHHAALAASAALATDIKNMIGVTASVDLREPGSVARSMGKAQRVIDNRKL